MTGVNYNTQDHESPCVGCPHVSKCRLGFACERFRAWSKTGAIDLTMSRTPRRSLYKEMFPADDAPMVDALLAAARKPQRAAA
jgi:hypothetical protein